MSLMAELGVDAPPPAKKPAPNLPVSWLKLMLFSVYYIILMYPGILDAET